MLFQGEEWAASTPFQFFTSHPEPELGRATAEGRIAEFERMGWDPAVVPDPQDPATYERSKLDWDELGTGRHAADPRGLPPAGGAAARRCRELTDPAFDRTACTVDEDARLFTMRRGDLEVVVNFGDAPGPRRRGRVGAALRHRSRGHAGRTLDPAAARGSAGRTGLTESPRSAASSRLFGRAHVLELGQHDAGQEQPHSGRTHRGRVADREHGRTQ